MQTEPTATAIATQDPSADASLHALLVEALGELLSYRQSDPERQARIDALIEGIDLTDTVALMRFGEPAFTLARDSGQKIGRFVSQADALLPQDQREGIAALKDSMEQAVAASRPPGWLDRMLGNVDPDALPLADRLPLLYMQVNQLALRLGHDERKLRDVLPKVRRLMADQLHAFRELGLYVAALEEKTLRVHESGEMADVERRIASEQRLSERFRLESWHRSALRLTERAGKLMGMRHAVAAEMLVLHRSYQGLEEAHRGQREVLDRDVAGWQQSIVNLAQTERQRASAQRIDADRRAITQSMQGLLTDLQRASQGAPDAQRQERLAALGEKHEALQTAMEALAAREVRLIDSMGATQERAAELLMQRLDSADRALERSRTEAERGARDPLAHALALPAPSEAEERSLRRARLPAPRVPR